MKSCGKLLQIAVLLSLASMVMLAGVFGATNTPAWHLIWSDEFDSPDGSAPNSTKWSYDLGGDGWGNNEFESYTSRRENSRMEGGRLIIEARKESIKGTDGITRPYTSARLKSKGKWSWTHGRIEARIKIPRSQGMWPAFWMLGANADSVGWPDCGEIDIMENIGKEPDTVHGTIHGPGYSGGDGIGKPFKLPSNQPFASDFHLFAADWETNRIRWSVDNQIYFTVTPANLPTGKNWVFEKPEFLILNLAVGGNWPGNPDSTTSFPQQMIVDYVRVYARTNAAPAKLELRKAQSEIELQWPGEFPHARLLGESALGLHWQALPLLGNYRSNYFVQAVAPGFYQLSLQP
jgi:beta-glucanase (GH16 family)